MGRPKIFQLDDFLYLKIKEGVVFSIHRLSDNRRSIVDKIPDNAHERETPLDDKDGASTGVRNIISVVRLIGEAL